MSVLYQPILADFVADFSLRSIGRRLEYSFSCLFHGVRLKEEMTTLT